MVIHFQVLPLVFLELLFVFRPGLVFERLLLLVRHWWTHFLFIVVPGIDVGKLLLKLSVRRWFLVMVPSIIQRVIRLLLSFLIFSLRLLWKLMGRIKSRARRLLLLISSIYLLKVFNSLFQSLLSNLNVLNFGHIAVINFFYLLNIWDLRDIWNMWWIYVFLVRISWTILHRLIFFYLKKFLWPAILWLVSDLTWTFVNIKFFAHFFKVFGQIEIVISAHLNAQIRTKFSAFLHLVSDVSLWALNIPLLSLPRYFLLLQFLPDPIIVHIDLILNFLIFLRFCLNLLLLLSFDPNRSNHLKLAAWLLVDSRKLAFFGDFRFLLIFVVPLVVLPLSLFLLNHLLALPILVRSWNWGLFFRLLLRFSFGSFLVVEEFIFH